MECRGVEAKLCNAAPSSVPQPYYPQVSTAVPSSRPSQPFPHPPHFSSAPHLIESSLTFVTSSSDPYRVSSSLVHQAYTCHFCESTTRPKAPRWSACEKSFPLLRDVSPQLIIPNSLVPHGAHSVHFAHLGVDRIIVFPLSPY
ncbi:hypothetical protein E2C01_026492 [Portunus trituberculatus]|uniref:Uncharacterized protein n=1 Tax=Portunus trituberculatus TaxID=210409 RepID=A0A5B7EFJ5_PORTR|nr:hypothetical protein [Portunus trituberculatus]